GTARTAATQTYTIAPRIPPSTARSRFGRRARNSRPRTRAIVADILRGDSKRKGGSRHGEDQDELGALDRCAQAVRPARDDGPRAARGSPRGIRRGPQHLRPDVQGSWLQGQGGEGLRPGPPEGP